MLLIAPDVLAEARGLTPAVAGSAVVFGLMLWLCGWRWHRFWVVFGVTMAAGTLGMSAGKAGGGQVMAIGLLLAVACGMMALELARLLAFGAGGVAAWLAVQAVLPAAQELWAAFLSGGLLGLLLYRLWTMLLTSFGGVLLAGHAGLILYDALKPFDVVGWVARNPAPLNGAVVALTVFGLLLQSNTDPHVERPAKPQSEKDGGRKESKKDRRQDDSYRERERERERSPSGWWARFFSLFLGASRK